MLKILRLISIVLACFVPNYFISQNSNEPFNSSFWNGYADRLQLSGKDRQEFISAHQRRHDQAVAQSTQGVMSQKLPAPTSTLFAGPCINADFEAGNMTGWVRSCGFNPGFNALGCCPNPNGQQAIMSGPGLDPAGGFPVVCPGGSFSLRLGNNVNGGEADRIEQTFLVSPSNANFSYKYAVVLEDPNHPLNQQPSFQVEMLDTTGAQVPCTFYYVAAGGGIPGFSISPTQVGVIYKSWTTVLVDLTPYIGQNITIRFTTYDCSLGGHFGYAYIDGVCQSFTGGGADTICMGGSKTFCAPTGVASYTWNGPGISNVLNQCINTSAQGVYTVQTTLFTGCVGPSFTYSLTTQNSPTVNAGPNATVCANNNQVTLSGTVSGFSSAGQWTSSGGGTFGSATSLNTTYTPNIGGAPSGTINLFLTSTINGVCPPTQDTLKVFITPSPTVSAGADQTMCSNATLTLAGSVTGPTGTGIWTTSGDGSFTPSATQLNAGYVPGPNDISSGTVTLSLASTGNGNCNIVSDTLKIIITKLAVVNASPSQTICSSSGTVALSGTVSGGVTTGLWSSTGTGGFNPSAGALNTNYNITPADISAGSVTFSLTSSANNPCPAVTATLGISIAPLATVSAGGNQVICSTTSTISLGGSVNGPGAGVWNTNGTGSFNPGNTSLAPTYNLSASDIVLGSLVFTLTSSNNGPCAATSDTVKISIIQTPTAFAGSTQTICSNTGSINLNGIISGGTGTNGTWATNGTGAFNPSANNTNTQYSISQADIISGIVTFTLTSVNNGPCAAGTGTTSLQVTPLATVSAGPNQYVCSTAGNVTLNGNVTSSGTGTWSSSSGSPFIPGNSSLNPSIAFTNSDVSAGFITFTLTSTNNGICPAVSDSVKIGIASIATVNAGPDKTICSSTSSVNLQGIVTGVSSTGYWSTTGSGGYNPAFNSLNTNYFLSSSDLATGFVNFTLTSTANGPCPAVTDTMKVLVTPLAIVNAGANQYICSTSSTISLSGMVNSNSNTGVWTTSGGGTFIPGNTSLSPIYSITPSDASNGSVTFTLGATGNAPCPLVNDTVKIKIKKPAQVNAGPDQLMCSSSPSIALSGTVSGGSNTGIWNTTGSGNFSPNNNVLNNFYNASPGDVSNGSVTLILTSTNNDICPAVSDTSKITIIKKPTIDLLNDTSICPYNNPLNIVASVTGGSGSYIWATTGSGTFAFTSGLNAVNYTMSQADINAGQVKLTITSVLNGPCGDLSESVNVIIHPKPIADFVASAYIANIPNDPIQFTNQSSGANQYYWIFGDGGFTNLVNPVHNYNIVGFYTVSLVATNQYGCKDTSDKPIKVISDVQFPNAFTPNPNGGNGGSYNPLDMSNDVFFPFTSGVTDYHLRIFNRWGELIFESSDINLGWDGYFNGKICQQDAYVWKADIKFFDGRKYNKTGSITLLR